MNAEGEMTVKDLRKAAPRHHFILLGYRTEENACVFNPYLSDRLTLNKDQYLILIGPGLSSAYI